MTVEMTFLKIALLSTITTMLVPYTMVKENYTLTVKITKFKNDDGHAMISLETPNQKRVQAKVLPIKNKEVIVVFENVAQGQYAVRFFHDENDNQKLDTNFLGIPTEGWGSSNNVKAIFGPPKFKNMLFLIDKNMTISAHIN